MKKIFRTVAFILALGSMSLSYTACTEDEDGDGIEVPDLTEQIDFSDIKAVAKADGRIEIEGKVTAKGKIKSLELVDKDGKVIADLLKSGDQEKVKEIDEAGEKNTKFTLSIPTTSVAVQQIKVLGKTRGGEKAESELIGEELDVVIGSSKNLTTGSYLSLKENNVYMMKEAEADPSKIDVIAKSSDDGSQVIGIQRATKAKKDGISEGAGKTALFDGNGDKIETDAYVTKGTIITASKCIATFTVTPSSDGTAAMKGIIIKDSKTLPLDVTAFTFSK